jgi:hypothetical protein
MATYKSSAGAILQPGNQINKLSGYNDEGVFGWPGVEAFELIGFSKITNKSGTKATFPASPVTTDLQGTNGEIILLGPLNGSNPFGVPTTQLTGLSAASASLSIGASGIAEGTADTTNGNLPFWTSVTSTIARADAADSMMFKVTSDTTFKIFNMDAITDTTANGDGVFISDTASDEGKAAYIVSRVNYLRPAKAVGWNDIQGFVDFASQVGGGDA